MKAQYFSLHKTLGVAIFAVAVLRILWALGQPRPVPLHPERAAESFLAALVHWLIYVSLVIVPLTGWIEHAASVGYAPILWPLGQDLPLVPKSVPLSEVAAALHFVFTKVLAVAVILHVAGALKHHLIDKDATLRRMISGVAAPAVPHRGGGHLLPLMAALVIYAGGAGLALSLVPEPEEAVAQTQAVPAPAGNWTVESGALKLTVKQMGAEVSGQFDRWTAAIDFDEAAATGKVRVEVDLSSLKLGTVTSQALGEEFLNAAAHPHAVFEAELQPVLDAWEAQGSLSLAGTSAPVILAFRLKIEGDRATMAGTTTLDRRTFGIGAKYGDEKSVGFGVDLSVNLIASRVKS